MLVDLSNCIPEDSTVIIPNAAKEISKENPKSALVLTDVTNAKYNKDVAEAIKNFVKQNTPFIKASAVVGAEGARLVLLKTVILITHREIKTFDDRPSAMDWLATH